MFYSQRIIYIIIATLPVFAFTADLRSTTATAKEEEQRKNCRRREQEIQCEAVDTLLSKY